MVSAWVGLACSDDDGSSSPRDAAPADGNDAGVVDAAPPDAAGPDASTDAGRPFCDPLTPEVCALPWPSNLYLNAGTNDELAFLLGALPINADLVATEPERLLVHDGYSVDTPIVVLFPGVDTRSLPNELQIEQSLSEDAQILLFRRQGIELIRVPYWVEVDTRESDPERRLLFVRPAERLLPGTTYIVAFRNLQTTDGEIIARSDAFQHFVDRSTTGTPLEPRQDRFDEVISTLVDIGIPRDELQLAWDFRTVSRRRLIFKLQALRQIYDQIRAEQGRVPFTVTSTTFHPEDPERFVTLEGELEVPWFLRPESIHGFEGEVLNVNPGDPTPIPVGARRVPFRMELPPSASDDVRDPPRSTVVQLGHPFLSSRDVLDEPAMARLANEQRFILAATDWPGLTADDAALWSASTQDLNRLQFVLDRILQGFVNQWALADALQWYYNQSFVLSVLNTVPGEVHYYGMESAAALGPALLASSPVLARGALAGGALDVVTSAGRSALGADYLQGPSDDLVDAYLTRNDAWVGVLTAQMFFDYVLSSLWSEMLDGGPSPFVASRALFTAVKGDRIAPLVDLEVLARTSTNPVALLENLPAGREPALLETAPYPREGSGVVWFDLGAPFPEIGARVPPGDGADPHDALFDLPAHRALIRRFIETGVIEDVCEGVCAFDP